MKMFLACLFSAVMFVVAYVALSKGATYTGYEDTTVVRWMVVLLAFFVGAFTLSKTA